MSEPEEDQDEAVIVTRVRDPVRADLIRTLLESEGIWVTVPGSAHRGMLGIEGAFLELPVLVRRYDLERAEELIEMMENHDGLVSGADADGDEDAAEEDARRDAAPDVGASSPRPSDSRAGPYRAPIAKRTAPSPRLKRISGFLAIAVTFGAGHWYARETTSGLVITLAQIAALWLAMTVHPWAIVAVLALVAYDFVGSMRASNRFNAGRPLSNNKQALRSLGAVAVSAGLVLALLPVASAIEARERAARVAEERRLREQMGLDGQYDPWAPYDPAMGSHDGSGAFGPVGPIHLRDLPLPSAPVREQETTP